MNFIRDRDRADGGRFLCRADPDHTFYVRYDTEIITMKTIININKFLFTLQSTPTPHPSRLFPENHTITRVFGDIRLNKSTVLKIFYLARYSINMIEITERILHPVC